MANLDKFNSLISENTSNWQENAKYQEENEEWLNISAKIALKVLQKLRKDNLSQKELAERMNVSPQQISKIVKGGENLTLETICKLEKALDIKLVEVVNNIKINNQTYVGIEIEIFRDEFPKDIELVYSFNKIESRTEEYSNNSSFSPETNPYQKDAA